MKRELNISSDSDSSETEEFVVYPSVRQDLTLSTDLANAIRSLKRKCCSNDFNESTTLGIEEPVCRLCGSFHETAQHILLESEAFACNSHSLVGSSFLPPVWENNPRSNRNERAELNGLSTNGLLKGPDNDETAQYEIRKRQKEENATSERKITSEHISNDADVETARPTFFSGSDKTVGYHRRSVATEIKSATSDVKQDRRYISFESSRSDVNNGIDTIEKTLPLQRSDVRYVNLNNEVVISKMNSRCASVPSECDSERIYKSRSESELHRECDTAYGDTYSTENYGCREIDNGSRPKRPYYFSNYCDESDDFRLNHAASRYQYFTNGNPTLLTEVSPDPCNPVLGIYNQTRPVSSPKRSIESNIYRCERGREGAINLCTYDTNKSDRSTSISPVGVSEDRDGPSTEYGETDTIEKPRPNPAFNLYSFTNETDQNLRPSHCPDNNPLKTKILIHTDLAELSYAEAASKSSAPETANRMANPMCCHICPFVTYTYELWYSHYKYHHKTNPRTCPFCGYNGCQYSYLEKHIMTVHLGRKPFTCPHCSFSTGWKSYFKIHVAKHSNKNLVNIIY